MCDRLLSGRFTRADRCCVRIACYSKNFGYGKIKEEG